MNPFRETTSLETRLPRLNPGPHSHPLPLPLPLKTLPSLFNRWGRTDPDSRSGVLMCSRYLNETGQRHNLFGLFC